LADRLGATLAVVGGGWAGIAAAVEATRGGLDVTLFEMASIPGGRARTVQTSEGEFDNGQHILIGAYRETLSLMKMVGVDCDTALLRLPLALLDADGLGLQLAGGPASWALLRAIFGHPRWSLRDKCALAAKAARWSFAGFNCAPELSVDHLCAGLPKAVRRDLIDPLCVAALNTRADDASARVFLRVLRYALFAGPGSSDLLLPRLPLGGLLPAPAERWLAQAGAQIRSTQRVTHIEPSASGGWCVDGQHFDHVVLACSATEAARLARPHNSAWADQASSLAHERIVTVYARSVGTRLSSPMLMLHDKGAGAPAQFVFDHGWLTARDGLLAFVISAAPESPDASDTTLVDATLRQGETQLRAQLKAPLQLVRSFAEKRATFRCSPLLGRPPIQIAPDLSAAGDYVEGPYPATLEGAVQSGLASARASLNAALKRTARE